MLNSQVPPMEIQTVEGLFTLSLRAVYLPYATQTPSCRKAILPHTDNANYFLQRAQTSLF